MNPFNNIGISFFGGDTGNFPQGPGVGYGLNRVIQVVLTGAISIAGLIVLFYFILGGFLIIKGAGSDDPQSSAKGKQAVTSAIIGFVLVFTAYWIIRIIELIVGVDFVTVPGI